MEITRNTDYHVVPIKLCQEEYDDIEKLAGTGYTPDEIAMYLSVDAEEFKRQLAKEDSLVRFHYNRGLLIVNYEISEKLQENARSGNITAVEIFQKRQEAVYVHNLRRKFFNDGH